MLIDSSIGYCYPVIEKHCEIIVSKSNLHRTPMYIDKMHPHNPMIFAKETEITTYASNTDNDCEHPTIDIKHNDSNR